MSTKKIDKPRISKKDKYPNERQDVLTRLYNILGITETNKIFMFVDLEKSPEKQNQIIALVPDIKQYFAYGEWSYFAKSGTQSRPYISLARSVIKDMGVKIVPMSEKRSAKVCYGIRLE